MAFLERARDRMETLRECSDAELRAQWRRHRGAEEDGDAAVTVALAAACEAAQRVDGRGVDDNMLRAGAELCRGRIVDAAPQDADDLAAIPACLAALDGWPFHVITVDDAGAVRIAGRLSARLAPLGLAVAAVTEAAEAAERRGAYAADVTVAPWEQLGYDYLRDNLTWNADERVGRGNGWAFLTEADHLLLDLEARTLFITAHDATLARIPSREYLQRYARLCGVTPVRLSDIAAGELAENYHVAVTRPSGWDGPRCRTTPDVSYAAAEARFGGLADAARERHDRGEAVVIGVGSVQDAERASAALRDRGVDCAAAVDRSDESLAALSHAADPGAFTVVSADAVRGRRLGSVDPSSPAPTVLIAGHATSRRTDDRLCALAAHPIVPGECCFFVSNDDEVVKPARSRASRMLDRLTVRVERRKGGMLAGRMLTQVITSVQDAWERHEAHLRTRRADYYAVEREQREQIYAQRDALIGADRPVVRVRELIRDVIDRHVREYPQPAELLERLATLYRVTVQATDLPAALDDRAAMLEHDALGVWQAQLDRYGNELMGTAAQDAELAILDRAWSEHLTELDRLRAHGGEPSSDGAGSLDGYRQAAARALAGMRERVEEQTVDFLFRVEISGSDDPQ